MPTHSASRAQYSPRSRPEGTRASSGATAATASAFCQGVSVPAPAALDVLIGRAAAAGTETPWQKADAVGAVAPLLSRVTSALEPIRRTGRTVIVEGYFDQIALCRAGVDAALATCGTSLTPDHARALLLRTKTVVLLFDGDVAGQAAAERSLPILLAEGLREIGRAHV